MVREERYLWFCQFYLHGENRLWWAYFRDQQAVDAFFRQIIGMFPCIVIERLEELKDGACFGPACFDYKLSDYIQAEKTRKLNKIRLHTNVGQPAPISRDHLSSFLFHLPTNLFCGRCMPVLPIVEEIAACARSKGRRRELALLVPGRGW